MTTSSTAARALPDDVQRSVALQRAMWAVIAVFALNGASFATFASRIPDVKAQLGLSAAGLGLFLLSGSAGSVAGLPLSGWVAGRLGSLRTVLIASCATTAGYAGAAIGVSLGNVALAAICLFVAGFGMGSWDVAMNLKGTVVERGLGKSIMPRFHAAFSGGTVVAALIAAGISAAHVSILAHVLIGMAFILATTIWCVRGFNAIEDDHEIDSPADEPEETSSHWGAWRERRVLLIGLVTLVAAFTEGTANDWMSVAFVEGHHVPKWAGILAFATFLSFMTCGRLVGTSLIDHFGRVPALRVCFGMAIAGCLVVVFAPTWLAYAGVAVWGVGVSLGFPIGMSAAADDPKRAHARISVVSTIAYTAFLAGPPLLGFLGQHVGVLHALLAVGAAALVALATVPAVREPAQRHTDVSGA
ncbi:fucose permease [Rudaeicoccus suwonensis]|uniref:Fucose permease n=2 Tax=Rudaeicoccus suwonensis TaxID=657409 RepID=A0A561E8A8_9MICO|nr:fucose permease [Rudaeicoccus suwonensis]